MFILIILKCEASLWVGSVSTTSFSHCLQACFKEILQAVQRSAFITALFTMQTILNCSLINNTHNSHLFFGWSIYPALSRSLLRVNWKPSDCQTALFIHLLNFFSFYFMSLGLTSSNFHRVLAVKIDTLVHIIVFLNNDGIITVFINISLLVKILQILPRTCHLTSIFL